MAITVFPIFCCNPIASIKNRKRNYFKTFPDGTSEKNAIDTDTVFLRVFWPI
jgi:anthranilate synthase component 1